VRLARGANGFSGRVRGGRHEPGGYSRDTGRGNSREGGGGCEAGGTSLAGPKQPAGRLRRVRARVAERVAEPRLQEGRGVSGQYGVRDAACPVSTG